MTVFPDGDKEALHGHNYQVELEVELTEPPALARMLSFDVFKQALRAVCDDWDEKILIANDNPWLEMLPGVEGEYAFRLCGKRYVLPADEVVALAADNITAENLARLLFEKFWETLCGDRSITWRDQIA
ncbi:6-carboxytetrahydropterin synthase, partial [Arthrospira platensis SPKY1]|nr:6-carboxytetrahydropterin synthase [Arthrospira platensis SPKY1]